VIGGWRRRLATEAGDGGWRRTRLATEASQYSSNNEGWRRTVCTEKKLLRKIFLIENKLLGFENWCDWKVSIASRPNFPHGKKKKGF